MGTNNNSKDADPYFTESNLQPPPQFIPLKMVLNTKEGDVDASPTDSNTSVAFTPSKTPDLDPWDLPELEDQGITWSELNGTGKVRRVLLVTSKAVALFSLLYIFICSLGLLSSAFRLLGGKEAGKLMKNSDLMKNPVVGLMIGVLVTVLVQSSSTSTSIVVTMVASNLIEVRQAVPIVMGANIGTSVTNTIVSLMQASDRNEFRRAFAAATVHDMFNWLTVFILLPVEVAFGYLEKTTSWIMSLGDWKQEKQSKTEFIQKLTKPLIKLVVELDTDVMNKIATGNGSLDDSDNLLKQCCKNVKQNNETICVEPCTALVNFMGLSDNISGILLLMLSLVLLCSCLVILVKLLHSMLKGRIAMVIKKYINAEYKFPYSLLIGYFAILVGCILTILVQSSSIFTSALTPLAGIGVISLERIYPLTLGSNIGTTTTGILAALAADSSKLHDTLQLAFCHLLFNVTGILIFYPIPYMRFPIPLAKMLGNTTAKYRWFSIFYLFMMFFVLPFSVFALSVAGKWVFIGVGGPIVLILLLVVMLNLVQANRPSSLPLVLRDWNWLPLWMHSLDPIDGLILKLGQKFSCLTCCIQPESRHDAPALGLRANQSQIHILDAAKKFSSSEAHLMQAYDNVAFIHWNGATVEGALSRGFRDAKVQTKADGACAPRKDSRV